MWRRLLQEVDEGFMNQEKLFAALKSLFADFAFDLCLVYAHCKLEDKEIMLSRKFFWSQRAR